MNKKKNSGIKINHSVNKNKSFLRNQIKNVCIAGNIAPPLAEKRQYFGQPREQFFPTRSLIHSFPNSFYDFFITHVYVYITHVYAVYVCITHVYAVRTYVGHLTSEKHTLCMNSGSVHSEGFLFIFPYTNVIYIHTELNKLFI